MALSAWSLLSTAREQLTNQAFTVYLGSRGLMLAVLLLGWWLGPLRAGYWSAWYIGEERQCPALGNLCSPPCIYCSIPVRVQGAVTRRPADGVTGGTDTGAWRLQTGLVALYTRTLHVGRVLYSVQQFVEVRLSMHPIPLFAIVTS